MNEVAKSSSDSQGGYRIEERTGGQENVWSQEKEAEEGKDIFLNLFF